VGMANWWSSLKPGEFRDGPWLSPEQTEFFRLLLRPKFRVFEHGSGGSTLWLAKQVASVVSVETNDAWRNAVIAEAEKRGLTNVRLLDTWPVSGGTPKRLRYDLVFIDGPGRERGMAIIDAFELLVKPGGWVVIDNAGDPGCAPKEWQAIRGRGEETIIRGEDSAQPFRRPAAPANTAFYHVFDEQYPKDV
jgi:predicted O-methyltransferase YrrM